MAGGWGTKHSPGWSCVSWGDVRRALLYPEALRPFGGLPQRDGFSSRQERRFPTGLARCGSRGNEAHWLGNPEPLQEPPREGTRPAGCRPGPPTRRFVPGELERRFPTGFACCRSQELPPNLRPVAAARPSAANGMTLAKCGRSAAAPRRCFQPLANRRSADGGSTSLQCNSSKSLFLEKIFHAASAVSCSMLAWRAANSAVIIRRPFSLTT